MTANLEPVVAARQPALKVIYATGYSPEIIGADPCLRPGANCLPKPFHPETLARMLRDCLDRPGYEEAGDFTCGPVSVASDGIAH